MIFAGCALISIVIWVCNWVCWIRQCCCFSAFDEYSNKIFVWWLCFIFFSGVIACCIAGFVTANRYGFCTYAVQCAYERIYYDTKNGQIKNTLPKWGGINDTQAKLSELNNINNVLNLDLTKFYLEKQDSINCDLIYPVPKDLVDKLCDVAEEKRKEIYQYLFPGVTSVFNLKKIQDYYTNFGVKYIEELNDIKDGLEEYKNKFINDFEYYVHVARGLGQILPIIYFAILLTTIVIALTLLIIYFCNCIPCWNQNYYIFPMHIIWNIIRFFIFSFFMYGCGYGMVFLLARDEIRFLKYILEEQSIDGGNTPYEISADTVKFFNYCLKGQNMFQEVYKNHFPDEFISNVIDFENWKKSNSVYSGDGDDAEIYQTYRAALENAYSVNGESLSYYRNIYNSTGSVYSILKCDFIGYEFNLLYTALWDFSWEARILCTISCFIGFLGVIGVYGFLWTMHSWRRDDNGGYRYVRNIQEGGYRNRNEFERPEEKINLKKRVIRPPNMKNNDMDDDNDNIDENNNNQQEMIEKNKEDEDEIS